MPKITPWSPQVLDTLENLIAPGGRARLSPYIEATQYLVLFGQTLDPLKRHQEIRKTLKDNEISIRDIADHWASFLKSRNRFEQTHYSDEKFLKSYLVYYFSTNIAKVQICLLDLLHQQELTNPTLNILDIGVGTATTSIAALDFIIAWKTVCDLFSIEFPIKKITINGIDKNQTVIDFSNLVLRAYGEILTAREKTTGDLELNFILDSIHSAHFMLNEIEKVEDLKHSVSPNLVIASNVYNELSNEEKNTFSRFLTQSPDETLILLIEPGDKERSRELMKFRNELSATKNFSQQGPCGHEMIGQNSESCKYCWNSRRQTFHQPELYLTFRKFADEIIKDTRGFDFYENHLLSWSNIWLKRGKPNITETTNAQRIQIGDSTEGKFLRFIGAYTRKIEGKTLSPQSRSLSHPEGASSDYTEVFKFCPGQFDQHELILERKPGFQIPILKHGELVSISKANFSESNIKKLILEVDDDSEIIPLESRKKAISFLPAYNQQTRKATDEIAYRLFGFAQMKEFQHRILERVMTGQSILGIAATGSGKSECFILPAVVLPGATVVVSPLVSLMMDQYDQRICERYGLNDLATYINGEVSFTERQTRLRRLDLGYYKLAYFTPEQLERGYVLDSLRRTNLNVGVRFLAMDEAHCISQWGHDFRPSYLNLVRRLKDYGVNPIRIALTATASPFVRRDVCEELGLNPELIEDGGDVFVESSNRPELNLIVRVCRSTDEKSNLIVDDLKTLVAENKDDKLPGSAIVFLPHTGGNPDNTDWKISTANRGKLSAGVSRFASFIERQLSQSVSIYHGKMEMAESNSNENERTISKNNMLGDMSGRSRRSEQESFIKGEKAIMIATKGFGMGIDKDNIRLIVHRTPPSNLEAYAQEAGRAGRDGDQADVILYYSPDSPEEDNGYGKSKKIQSDYDIQNFFLNENYIRKEDVIVMRAFLKTVNRKIGSNLYFTNDEAIEFFEKCCSEPNIAYLATSYQWPQFPTREPSGWESDDHRRILDKGHDYQNKTNYLNRILQVLYRIRPGLPELGPRVPFLEQVQEVGSKVIKPIVKNINSILNSNAYFGKIFRRAGFSTDELFTHLMSEDIIPLANELNLTLYETTGLLYDIKYAEGRFNYKNWQPFLFDFRSLVAPKYGPAQGKDSLADWREYAGAYKRATKPVAKRRAVQNRRPKQKKSDGEVTELDDWFSWDELNRTRGWEINPGLAFFDEVSFDEYLQAFMNLHNQRMENDWSSYWRLLTDYVGVSKDGEFQPDWHKGNCLRAVLLGYLETYEVITGDNCYGCSRCVPSGNFRQFSISQKREAVTRISPAVIELFDQLKSQSNTIPEKEEEQLLFSEIKQEEKAGHSLKAYFSGWSSRMLDQVPGHRAALWLRFVALGEGTIAFQPEEFIENSSKLFNLLTESSLARWFRVMETAEHKLINDPRFYHLLAKYYQHTKSTKEEESYLIKVFSIAEKNPKNYRGLLQESSTRLVEIYETKNSPKSEPAHKSALLIASRTSTEYSKSKDFYRRFVSNWKWAEIKNEVSEQKHFTDLAEIEAALYIAWIDAENLIDAKDLITHLKKDPDIIKNWTPEIRIDFTKYISRKTILDWPDFQEYFFKETQDKMLLLEIGLELLAKEKNIPLFVKKQLATSVLDQESSRIWGYLNQNLVDSKRLVSILDSLFEHAEISNWEQVEQWLNVYPKYWNVSSKIAFDLLSRASEINFSGELKPPLIKTLTLPCLNDPETAPPTKDLIIKISLTTPQTFQYLVEGLPKLELDDFSDLMDEILNQLIERKNISWLIKLKVLDHLPKRWKYVHLLTTKSTLIAPLLRRASVNKEIQGSVLNEVCNHFEWQKDVEQADMLALILDRWLLRLNPNWKTPIVKFLEVLVAAQRIEYAEKILKLNYDLYIYQQGKRMSAEEFIRSNNQPRRTQPYSKDYQMIIKQYFNDTIRSFR